MNQLSELFLPMVVVAMVDDSAHARDQLGVAPCAERAEVKVSGDKRATREQFGLILSVGRPPGLAVCVDRKRQTRERLEAIARRNPLDSYLPAAHEFETSGTLEPERHPASVL